MFDIGQAIGHFARACRVGESNDPTKICERMKGEYRAAKSFRKYHPCNACSIADLAQLIPGEQGRQSMERAATLMEVRARRSYRCQAYLTISFNTVLCHVGNSTDALQSQSRQEGQRSCPFHSTSARKLGATGLACAAHSDISFRQVAEAVRTVFGSAQDIIRDFAANFKNTEATDILVGQNHVVDLVKALGLPEAVSDEAACARPVELTRSFEPQMIVPDVRKTEQAVRESRQLATKEIFRELKRRSDG